MSIHFRHTLCTHGDQILLIDQEYTTCAENELTHSVTFTGFSTEIRCDGSFISQLKNRTGISTEKLQYLLEFKTVFEVQGDVEIKFSGIIFTEGSIHFSNTMVDITNCTFKDVSLYYMHLDTLQKVFSQENLCKNNLGNFFDNHYYYEGYEDYTWNDFRYWGIDSSYFIQCQEIKIQLENVVFFRTAKKNITTVYQIAGNREFGGIQIICQDIHLKVANASFAKVAMNIYSLEEFHFEMMKSSMVGDIKNFYSQGGLRFYVSKSMTVSIKDSTFSDLAINNQMINMLSSSYQDNLEATIRPLDFPISALFIRIMSNKDTTVKNIEILNSIFTSNSGGITLKNHAEKNPSDVKLTIIDSTFGSNALTSNGAAIHAERIETHIINSTFINNKAGYLSNEDILSTTGMSFVLDKSLLQILRIHLVEGILTVHYSRQSSLSECKLDTLSDRMAVHEKAGISLAGYGGAIYANGGKLNIAKSSFKGNIASKFGGSIYSSKNTKLSIESTSFEDMANTSQISSTISASGDVILSNVTLYVGATKDHHKNGLYCIWDDKNAGRGIKLKDIFVHCTNGARLITQNISIGFGEWTWHNQEKDSEYLYLREVRYICRYCPEDTYSIADGQFSLEFENGTHMIERKDVQCHECPFEGKCHGYIRAKPNYWGKARNDIVRFFKCPPKYCCSSQDCETYDQCYDHRERTLCGVCRHGFSEALFSTVCLKNESCNFAAPLFLGVTMALVYAVFLMFQGDVKKSVTQAAKPWAKVRNVVKMSAIKKIKVQQGPKLNTLVGLALQKGTNVENNSHNLRETNDAKSSGQGIALILLFYYFQDASIIHFNPTYSEGGNYRKETIKAIVGGLFNFQLDIFQFTNDLCFSPDITPIGNAFYKLTFVPLVFITLFILSIIFKILGRKYKTFTGFSDKFKTAVSFAVLFSYQKAATTTFSLLYCVPVYDENVLFLNGNLKFPCGIIILLPSSNST